MDYDKEREFNVYRGLQRPLILHSLKGKFIYWGAGCIMAAFITAILLAILVHPFTAIVGFLVIGLGGMLFIHNKQKGGLHTKTKSAGTYIIAPQLKRASRK